MTSGHFSLDAYFQRIGYRGKGEATLACVADIVRHQLCSVPFENLDVQAGKLVSIQADDIVDKIIARKRGGYCYEVNGIFSMAMTALQVPYFWVAARPMFYPTRRPKTHMAVVVTLEGRQWLCDLGFGSYGLSQPLALDVLDVDVKQGHDTFKLSKLENGDYLLQAWVDGAWKNQFAFDMTPQEWVDFEPMNFMNSKHPDAVFVKSLVVILHSTRGRSILFGNSFKSMVDGQVSQRILADAEIDAVLQQTFGLNRAVA